MYTALRAIVRRVGHRMTPEAIGHALQQGWAFALAGTLDSALARLAGGDQVHAVNLLIGHAIAGGAIFEVLHRPGFLDRHAHRILVILADINHRQLAYRSEI